MKVDTEKESRKLSSDKTFDLFNGKLLYYIAVQLLFDVRWKRTKTNVQCTIENDILWTEVC